MEPEIEITWFEVLDTITTDLSDVDNGIGWG